jgi:hypothetical protein
MEGSRAMKGPGIALAVSIAACAGISAAQTGRPAQSDALSRLFGNTVVSMTPDGTRVHYFVEPDGTLSMRTSDGVTDEGRWRVREQTGDTCVTWRSLRNGEELCSWFRLDGDNLVQTGADGRVLNVAKVMPGRLGTF